MLNPNVPAWFEIPAVDLDRAQRFYETALGQPFKRETMGEVELAVFPYGGQPMSSGALIRHERCSPSMDGTTVYLSVENLSVVLDRLGKLDAQTVVPRTALPEGMGFFAQFRDCEGNRVGLWSPA
ncbi:MAG TPA: VOC family protein [Tahibacter sp.]|nr:VOC family protein [Tahibacter sp.]